MAFATETLNYSFAMRRNAAMTQFACLATLIALTSVAIADQNAITTYTRARGIFWAELYPEKTNGRPHSDLYCGFEFRHRDDVEMQIEHAYPASWIANALGCGTRTQCQDSNNRFNLVEADLHNLWPSEASANGARSNHSFAVIRGEEWLYEDCNLERAKSDIEGLPTKSVVEPREIARGNLARSIFYMADEYSLPIEERLVELLQRWNRSDPVSADERRRNAVIEELQGTRNKFIDDPSLIDRWR